MSTPEKGAKSLSDLRTLLQSLADQLDDADEDRTSMSRNTFGIQVPSYLVSQSAPPAEQERAADAITKVLALRLESIRTAIGTVDGLATELAQGPTVDYKKIQFPGIEELLG